MLTIVVVALPYSFPLIECIRRLKEETRRHSWELAGAKGETREAKLEVSLVKKDNDKMMGKIIYLRGRLKRVEKKHVVELDKITEEKRQLSSKCQKLAR